MRDDPIDLQSPSYTPVRLLNETAYLLHCKNDRVLAMTLEVNQAVITRIRKRQAPITAGLMVQIMDRTGWHIQHVRELAGMPYDGVAKLVVLAQRIGFRFPNMYLQCPEAQEGYRGPRSDRP